MRVILDTERVSLGGIQRIGDAIDLPDSEAQRLIEDSQAHLETTMHEQKREKAIARGANRGR